MAPGGQAGVHVLDLRRRPFPRQLLAQRVGSVRAAARADRRRTTSRVSWAASVSTSPGSNSSPRSPSPRISSYTGRRAASGTAPPAIARSSSPGAGERPGGGEHRDLGAVQHRRRGGVVGTGHLQALAHLAAHGGQPAGLQARPHRRAPLLVHRQPAQRAQEQAQGGALLAMGEGDPHAGAVASRPARRRRRRASPRGSRRGRTVPSGRPWPRTRRCARPGGRRTARPPAGPPGWPATRSVGAWKEPTLSAREWRSAALDVLGANGSCTCTKSGSAAPSASSTLRATSTGSERAPRRDEPTGSTSPTASSRGGWPLSGSSSSPPSPAAAIARRESRTRLDEVEGATIATRCPACASRRRQALDVAVDLVPAFPRVRGHVRDRKALAHRLSIGRRLEAAARVSWQRRPRRRPRTGPGCRACRRDAR